MSITPPFVFASASAGTMAHAKMKTVLLSLITDELKHCWQTLLSYGSVAVYLSRGQACARRNNRRNRVRRRD